MRSSTPSIPNVIAIGGGVGSGKSTVASALAAELEKRGRVVRFLRSDVIRKKLLGIPEDHPAPKYCYVDDFRSLIYRVMHETAQIVLRFGDLSRETVILDAAYSSRSLRECLVAGLGGSPGGLALQRFWLEADTEVRVSRVGARRGDASDATAEFARIQLIEAPAVDEGWFTIDSGQELRRVLERVRAALSNQPQS